MDKEGLLEKEKETIDNIVKLQSSLDYWKGRLGCIRELLSELEGRG